MSDVPTQIECSLVPHQKFESLFGVKEGEKTKFGSYHGSYFWNVKGFGATKWVVVAELKADLEVCEGLTMDEKIEACIAFLNIPVGRRKKKAPYGNLELFRYSIREDGSIVVLFITDQRKNKHFWGKGHSVPRRLRAKR